MDKIAETKSAPGIAAWKAQFLAETVQLIAIELPEDVHSLDQASQRLPPGAYTTLRTYPRRRALHLEEHFHRLEETAGMVGAPVILPRGPLRQALRQALAHFPVDVEVRLRLTIDLDKPTHELYILAEKLVLLPPQAYQQGVKVILCDLQRQLPRAKLTRFIERSSPLRQALPADVNEALMVDAQGNILEGLSSNFFAMKDGLVYTAEQGVLAGTTREMALNGLIRLGLPVVHRPLQVAELGRLDEAFITSASRSILPVRQVEDYWSGAECPGPLTRRLMVWFEEALARELEEI